MSDGKKSFLVGARGRLGIAVIGLRQEPREGTASAKAVLYRTKCFTVLAPCSYPVGLIKYYVVFDSSGHQWCKKEKETKHYSCNLENALLI